MIEEKDLEYMVGEDPRFPDKMVHAIFYVGKVKSYRVDKYLPKGEGLSKIEREPMVALVLAKVNDEV